MFQLKTSYTWNPTGDRYEQKVIFDREKDAYYALTNAIRSADAIIENECVDIFDIELIRTESLFKKSVGR